MARNRDTSPQLTMRISLFPALLLLLLAARIAGQGVEPDAQRTAPPASPEAEGWHESSESNLAPETPSPEADPLDGTPLGAPVENAEASTKTEAGAVSGEFAADPEVPQHDENPPPLDFEAGGGEMYEAPEPMVYVLTVKGRGFGTEQSRVFVRVNNVKVAYTILHNETAVSFVVPDALIEDEAARVSSTVEIDVGGEILLKSVPLVALVRAVKRVPLTQFLHPTEPSAPNTGRAAHTDEGGKGGEGIASDETFAPVDNSASGADAGQHPKEKRDSEKESMSEEEWAWLASFREAFRDLTTKGTSKSSHRVLQVLNEGLDKDWPRASHHLAVLHLIGDTPGFARDFDKAIPLLKSASDAGYADSQAMMGLLYASGLAEPLVGKDTGKAILMWTIAAEAGSSYAKTALAYRFYAGVDVPEDCDKAAVYYEQVSREIVLSSRRRSRGGAGSDEEKEGLAQIRPPTPRAIQMADRKRLEESMEPRARGEDNEVIQYYKHTAERGDPPSQVMMGNLYYYGGANMPQDPVLARSLFERAAKNGRADAHAHLGFMDLHAGKNVSAVDHLRKAAAKGDKLGFHGMGYVTLHGIGVEQDDVQAAGFFGKAAEAEHPEAMFNLGLMYSKGIGVEPSPEQAFRYYQEAARFGHLESSFNVGMMRLLGTPPARQECNVAIAKYLKDVAQQGPWNVVLSKALRSYEKGDYGNALFRYVQAAHVGIELAQYNAAFMFEHNKVYNRDATLLGKGLNLGFVSGENEPSVESGEDDQGTASQSSKPSKRKGGGMEWNRPSCVANALDLYQMSSAQGYSPSMVRLGDLAYGEGKDFIRATHAYEKAARMRNAEAAFNLGWMHAVGYVSKPDANLAKRYFDQARDMDSRAILPATIAVYMLRYHSSMVNMLAKWRKWRGEENEFDSASGKSRQPDDSEMLNVNVVALFDKELWEQYGDVALLSVLFGLLGIIVNARQRRLVEADDNQAEHALQDGDDGVNEIPRRADGNGGVDEGDGGVDEGDGGDGPGQENNLRRRVVQR